MKTLGKLPYMVPSGPQTHITEEYVSSPPALVIIDEAGTVWSLGPERREGGPRGEYAFDVVAFDRYGSLVNTGGEIASRIERRGGRVRVFTGQGWKRWTGFSFI